MIERIRSPDRNGLAASLAAAYCALASAGAFSAPAKWLVALLLTSAVLFAACAMAAIRDRVALTSANVVAWALVFRLAFLFVNPVLSDDVWRYLWDGKVSLSGFNPYSFAPDDHALVGLRDEVWARVNHRSIPTLYPPFAQLLFRVVASHGGLVAWKLLVAGFDLGTIAALAVALRGRAEAPKLLLLYAWNPLVVVEFAWSGHVDAVAVAISTWAIVVARRRHPVAAVALASIAAGVKLFPALLLPGLLRQVRARSAWGIPVAFAIAGFAPYVSSGVPAWFSGLRTYARHWEFNSLPHLALRVLVDDPIAVRSILGAALVMTVVAATLRRRDPADSAVAVLGACIALNPTVHPWYVTWPLPAAILSERPPRAACLVATLAVLASYVVLVAREATGEWRIPRAWLTLEWVIVAVALGAECILYLRRSGDRGP